MVKYLGTLSPHWPRSRSEDSKERQIYWQVVAAIGRILQSDYGKHVYESDGVIQVENDSQRDSRLAKCDHCGASHDTIDREG